MSKCFINRRQEFIAATLRQFGQIRRADLVREFEVTNAVASADIATFLDCGMLDGSIRYDVSAKIYVFEGFDHD
jgi:DeoR/GlpR family transcriptional regulator of sugar metabolism